MRAVGAILVSILVAAPLGAVARAESPSGEVLYRRSCASCHGPAGRGDGPLASVFARRPRDLYDGVLTQVPPAQLAERLSGQGAAPLKVDVEPLQMRARDTEAMVAFLKRLSEVDWRAWDAGEAIFSARCASCHGPFGHPGGAALPPGVRPPRDLSSLQYQQATSAGELIVAVRHGRAGMPALTPRVSEASARDVAAFVRLLSPGYATYTQYCASCHGEHGVGRGSFGESYAVPTVIFDRAYFARSDPEALRRDVWHMLRDHEPSMPHVNPPLSAAELERIVTYLNQAAPTPRP